MISEAYIGELFPTLEADLVAQMSARAEIRTFPEGQILMSSGQQIRFSLLLTKGVLKIYREDDKGNEFLMYYLHPGQACALSMLGETRDGMSQVMAKAMTEVEVIAIDVNDTEHWLVQYKTWQQFVVDSYRSRFEELLDTIDQIAFCQLDERLLFYLRRHQGALGTSRFPISITEIAGDLNSSREVISRLLRKLSDKGLLSLDKSVVELR
jgi:CRP/FNR family transcriptional regulator